MVVARMDWTSAAPPGRVEVRASDADAGGCDHRAGAMVVVAFVDSGALARPGVDSRATGDARVDSALPNIPGRAWRWPEHSGNPHHPRAGAATTTIPKQAFDRADFLAPMPIDIDRAVPMATIKACGAWMEEHRETEPDLVVAIDAKASGQQGVGLDVRLQAKGRMRRRLAASGFRSRATADPGLRYWPRTEPAALPRQ